MRAHEIGVNQQVTNQQEALIEIKIGLSPRCQFSLAVRHNALFILYVIDYNCLFIYFLSYKHTDTNAAVSHKNICQL